MGIRSLTSLVLLCLTSSLLCAQEPFEWNKEVPIKRPGANDNGKLVLFDVSHGGTQGNADWVIDGGFSDFADALVTEGFTVQEYRGVDKNGDSLFTFVDDRKAANVAANEAIITFDAIKHADVFVLAETNRPLRKDEYAALMQFVHSGKGIYFVSDHYNADRNLNTWDSTEVFNGYNRSDAAKYNMEPHYGDLRNPKDANAGWLARNFGVRFRFNAVDWKPGASSIVDPDLVEGLTEGAGPVLIAAGGSLSIVDPTTAKGLVYFSDTDDVKSWRNAVEGSDGGMYFGGIDEGPVVAISKPNAGKAAFIGDSSPVEDKTGRYRREENGRTKPLHAGWTSGGNAAQLSLNIVKWLATPENYFGFDSAEHPSGFATPEPMADAELDDPDNGNPWREPRGQYDPWDPNTFQNGAYGARFPASSSGGGGQVPTGPPISVAGALTLPGNQSVTVVGRVTSEINTQFGLVLSDLEDSSKSLAVQVPSRFRDEFNPVRNPAILNQIVTIAGRRDRYMGLPGMKGVTAIVRATSPEIARESAIDRMADESAASRTIASMSDTVRRSTPGLRPAASPDRLDYSRRIMELQSQVEDLQSEIWLLRKLSDAPVDSEVANTIQIGTYNLELLGKSRKPFNRQRRPFRSRQDLKDIADRIVNELDLEIVVFQEINTASRNWSRLKSLLADQGYQFFEGTTSERDQFVVLAWDADEVAVVANSLHEMNVRTGYRLSDGCRTDGLRKPVAGQFKAGEFDFWVVGVHLKSRVGSGSCPSRIRTKQTEELVSRVDELIASSGERDVIIVGDFNQRNGHRSFDPLTNAEFVFQTRFLTANSGAGSYIKMSNPHESDDLIDHIVLRYSDTREVVRNGTTVYPIDDRATGIDHVLQQSDHVPVWSSFYVDDDLDDND